LSEEEVLGALRRQVEARVAWASFTRLGVMGLDEMALKKGRDDLIVLVTSKQPEEELRLLAVLPDRKKETVIAFLRTIPEPVRETITEVCIDMHEGYANGVKEVLPGVPLVVDRFHMAKAYRECADNLRKSEMRELTDEHGCRSNMNNRAIVEWLRAARYAVGQIPALVYHSNAKSKGSHLKLVK
jgi:transposase